MDEHAHKERKIAGYVALVAILVLIVQLVSIGSFPIKRIAFQATENLATIIGVAGSVAPNEFNQLAQQFDKKEKELTSREQGLALREQSLLNTKDDHKILYMMIGIGILIFLLLLNFYLDWKREKHGWSNPSIRHDGDLLTRL